MKKHEKWEQAPNKQEQRNKKRITEGTPTGVLGFSPMKPEEADGKCDKNKTTD
jgi:hypothetical protein